MNIKAHHDYQRHAINWGECRKREIYTHVRFQREASDRERHEMGARRTDHKLECMGGAQFNVVKVRDSGGPLQLAQALPQPRGSRVSISSAWVARVEEMQTKGHPDGNLLFWRDVELLSRDPRGRVPELATRASELYPYITALPHSCP